MRVCWKNSSVCYIDYENEKEKKENYIASYSMNYKKAGD